MTQTAHDPTYAMPDPRYTGPAIDYGGAEIIEPYMVGTVPDSTPRTEDGFLDFPEPSNPGARALLYNAAMNTFLDSVFALGHASFTCYLGADVMVGFQRLSRLGRAQDRWRIDVAMRTRTDKMDESVGFTVVALTANAKGVDGVKEKIRDLLDIILRKSN